MKRNFFHVIFCITISGLLSAQSITNVQTKQEGNTIVVTYDLQCNWEAITSLFISEDGGKNFTGPLKSVSGDIGTEIKSGTNKKIVWDVTKDTSLLFSNNIVFRVKALPGFKVISDSRDGKTYKTAIIGNQTWMIDNLNFKSVTGSWCYDNNDGNCNNYGRLYDWQTAQNACPVGWHLPSKSDFETLLNNVGGSGNSAYNTLIENGESNFNALAGGWFFGNGSFGRIGSSGNWWSSFESNAESTWGLNVDRYSKSAFIGYYDKKLGFSVRCIKD